MDYYSEVLLCVQVCTRLQLGTTDPAQDTPP